MSGGAANLYPDLLDPPPGLAQPLNPAPGSGYAVSSEQPDAQVSGAMPVQEAYPAYPTNPAIPEDPDFPPGSYVPMRESGKHSPVVPNQPVVYPNEQLSPSRLMACIYIVSALVIVVLCLIDLLLTLWVEYCDFDISLTNYKLDGSSASLNSAVDVFCPWDEVSVHCGDVCSNFRKLRDAGHLMKGMGIPAIVSLALPVLGMLLFVFRPIQSCGVVAIRIAVVLTSLVWIIATVIYLVNYIFVSVNSGSAHMKAGLLLALIISVLQLVNCLLGNVAVSKLRR